MASAFKSRPNLKEARSTDSTVVVNKRTHVTALNATWPYIYKHYINVTK